MPIQASTSVVIDFSNRILPVALWSSERKGQALQFFKLNVIEYSRWRPHYWSLRNVAENASVPLVCPYSGPAERVAQEIRVGFAMAVVYDSQLSFWSEECEDIWYWLAISNIQIKNQQNYCFCW